MSSRSTFRRKVVLPVTITRCNGQEKQLAHTLDLTENSARLGGLPSPLEPGEIIEVQRGAVKAKFQVFWMGASGSTMDGQAGVRSLEPNKSIWGVALDADETDLIVDPDRVRDPMAPVCSATEFPGEKRWNPRYVCSGGVSIKTAGAKFAIHGEVKDLSKGGIYVELMTPLPVNSLVTLNMTIEGIGLEAAGIVRTSYPLVGMAICFTNLPPHDQDKVTRMIKKIREAEGASPSSGDQPEMISQVSVARSPLLCLDEYPASLLASACDMLADDLDEWKSVHSAQELEQVRKAVTRLHEKLLQAVSPVELLDYFATTVPHDGRTQ